MSIEQRNMDITEAQTEEAVSVVKIEVFSCYFVITEDLILMVNRLTEETLTEEVIDYKAKIWELVVIDADCKDTLVMNAHNMETM